VEWLRAMALLHLGRPAESREAAERGCATASPLLAPVIESTRLQALWYLGDIQPVLEGLPRLADRAAAAGMRDNAALMAAGAAMAHAAVGASDRASRYLEVARSSAATPDTPLVDAYLTVAGATTSIAQGDESAARRLLNDYIDRSPALDTGVAASLHRRSLALWFVLAPSTRRLWDEADLAPCYARARQLARTIVARRAGPLSRRDLPELEDLRTVRALLPTAWTVELALAYAAASRREGWALLEATWPQSQAEVRRHAEASVSPLGKAARTALSRLPVPPRHRLELCLLGPAMVLRRDGRLVDAPEWRRERVRSLLAYLALNRSASRERVALELWPELDAEAQSRNLRITLSHLLRALEPERAERDASFMVRTHGSALVLYESEWLDVDVWRFDGLWREATAADREGHASVALGAMLEAVGLWRRHPSEIALNEWALAPVEERRVELVTMAARAGQLLLAQGELDEARRVAEVALHNDPWCERAHDVVVATHEAAGRHHAARSARRRLEEARRELLA